MKGQQELLYVVPFVAKVLESSLRSVVIIQFSLQSCCQVLSVDQFCKYLDMITS